MGLGGVFRVGVGEASAGSCKLRSRSNDGEGGGELCERPRERHSCVTCRKDDELHMSPVSLEGRDKGGVLRGLGLELGVAAEVTAKSTSMMMWVQRRLLKVVGSGEGESCTPLA